jgi:hypothetical protein
MNISSYLCNYFGEPRKTQTSALRSFDKMLIYISKLRFCLIDLVETPHARHYSSKLDTALTLSAFSQALIFEFLEVTLDKNKQKSAFRNCLRL